MKDEGKNFCKKSRNEKKRRIRKEKGKSCKKNFKGSGEISRGVCKQNKPVRSEVKLQGKKKKKISKGSDLVGKFDLL